MGCGSFIRIRGVIGHTISNKYRPTVTLPDKMLYCCCIIAHDIQWHGGVVVYCIHVSFNVGIPHTSPWIYKTRTFMVTV
jgi:hypothetical protein